MNTRIPVTEVFIAFGLTIFLQMNGFAAEWDIEKEISLFQTSPKIYRNQLPAHWDQFGNLIPSGESLFFSKETLLDRKYVEVKTKKSKIPNLKRAPIGMGDHPDNFVDQFVVSRLEDMELRQLESAKVGVSPWSDSYWPIAQGVIANRYLDLNFPGFFDWKASYDYMMQRIDQKDPVELLSPAEKYDLLVGDENHSLTRQMFAEGKAYYDENGTVELWMGICHGWAPASYMVKRPKHAIKVLAADGVTEIMFNPTDMKALTSLIWANGRFPLRQMGRRCDVKVPKMDENGRVIESGCFDDNPASWHLAVVNQIGLSHRPFIMDATYDYQVWNQPVVGYKYSYFNPKTAKKVDSLKEAVVPLNEYPEDKFKKYRGSESTQIVGVAMEVTYTLETGPSRNLQDGPENDAQRTVRYLYDLELDERGIIVGGEWFTNFHPDFLWGPTKDAKIYSPADMIIEQSYPGKTWELNKPLPLEWAETAQAAAKYGQPLGHIVEQMVKWAQ